MIGTFTKGKVAVFIDAANIFYSQRTLGWRISYEKLKEYFERECEISTLFVYCLFIPPRTKRARSSRSLSPCSREADLSFVQSPSRKYELRTAYTNGKATLTLS